MSHLLLSIVPTPCGYIIEFSIEASDDLFPSLIVEGVERRVEVMGIRHVSGHGDDTRAKPSSVAAMR